MQVYGPKNGGRSCEQVAVDTDGKGLSIACRDLHPACQTTVQDIGKKFSPRYSEGYLYPGISVTTLGGFAGSVRLVSEYGISYDLVRKKYENWDFDDSLGVCGYFIKNQNVAWEQYEFEGLWSHNKPWYRHTFDVAGINMSDNSNFTKPFGTIGVFGYSASEKRYVVYCMLITYQQLIGPDFERKKAVVSDLYPCQQGLCKVPGGP
ncbi:hypothetical protein HY627_02130 [Candidatus Uhrbacteria bacterium]|nr:hypothetical protein [Candidatus Uhrbacteria bacterium]